MLDQKVKIKKKKDIKDDKLVETYYKAVAFYSKYQKKILTYAGVVVVAILAIVIYANIRSEKNEKASMELGKIMPYYEQGAFLDAINGVPAQKILGLKKIVSEYGSTENGETAKIYLANAYMFMGKLDEAYKYYDDYSGSVDMFKAAALAGKAGYFATKKDYEKSADLFLKASKVSKTNVQNPEYLLSAGEYYIQNGNKEKARDLFVQIKTDYEDSFAARECDRYLQLVDD